MLITLTLLLLLLLIVGAVVLVLYDTKQREHRAKMRRLVSGKPTYQVVTTPLQAEDELPSSQLVSVPLRQIVPKVAQPADNFFDSARISPFDALGYLQNGDIYSARLAMQKISYMVHADKKANPQNIPIFTALMCKFVKIDPLFYQGLAAVYPLIEATPGIKQTALYCVMPMDVENARYVLYFAHETGQIVRKKKGNSYEVYLPHQPIPEAAKPVRKSKK